MVQLKLLRVFKPAGVTVCIFLLLCSYSEADTSRQGVLDGTGIAIGFIDFTTEFKYRGSIVHHSLTSLQTSISALDQHRPPSGLLKTF
jgi:hypothetical protein